jgi:uncharacterized cupin superfamily protein
VQEQIYHVLEGEGLMQIDGKKHVVRKHDVIYLPPALRIAIENSGLVDLVVLVVTSAVTDEAPYVGHAAHHLRLRRNVVDSQHEICAAHEPCLHGLQLPVPPRMRIWASSAVLAAGVRRARRQ